MAPKYKHRLDGTSYENSDLESLGRYLSGGICQIMGIVILTSADISFLRGPRRRNLWQTLVKYSPGHRNDNAVSSAAFGDFRRFSSAFRKVWSGGGPENPAVRHALKLIFHSSCNIAFRWESGQPKGSSKSGRILGVLPRTKTSLWNLKLEGNI